MLILPYHTPAKLPYGGGEEQFPLYSYPFVQSCSRDTAGCNVDAVYGCGFQLCLNMQEMIVMEPSVSMNYQVTSTRLACEIRRMLRR
jgi:hypothetical protein